MCGVVVRVDSQISALPETSEVPVDVRPSIVDDVYGDIQALQH